MLGLKLCGVLILGVIMYQDLRQRSVHVGLFVGLFLIVCMVGCQAAGGVWLRSSMMNLGAVVCMLLASWAYLSLRAASVAPLLDHIGLGDIAFMAIAAFGFTWPGALLFLVCAMAFAVVAHLVVRRLLRTTDHTIAMAGWSSLCWLCLWLAQLSNLEAANVFDAY